MDLSVILHTFDSIQEKIILCNYFHSSSLFSIQSHFEISSLSIVVKFCYDRNEYLCKETPLMKKKDRLQLIKKLIHDYPVRTQDELLTLLEQNGMPTTQATISRDIRELRIVKIPDDTGQTRFEIFPEEQDFNNKLEDTRLEQMIPEVVTTVDRVQFLTIVHTIADNAPILAAAVDEIEMEEKICSLAGFDIVVIISKTDEHAQFMEAFFKDRM